MLRRSLLPRAAPGVALALAGLLAACGGDAGTGPDGSDGTVATVIVTPAADTLAEGDTTRLSAEALDANDNTVEDASFSWDSDDTSVATVDSTGLVTAQGAGRARISATAEQVADTAEVDVKCSGADCPTISSTSPSPLEEGQSATISGDNFSSTASDNVVLIDGDTATVTSATTTSLDVTVPTYDCLPARDVSVEVSTPAGSDVASASMDPDEAPVSLSVGEQRLIQDPAQFCLQFAETTSEEAYLVGVQSTSHVDGLTPVQATAVTDSASASADRVPMLGVSAMPVVSGPGQETELDQLWRRHWEAESRLRQLEERRLPRAPLADGTLPPSVMAQSVPGTVGEGDTVTLRVPDINNFSCDNYFEVQGVVVHKGTDGYWINDVDNPDDHFTDSELTAKGDQFDNDILPEMSGYFGSPTDIDSNSRGIFLFTKEVNEMGGGGLLGFVTSGDLVDRSDCSFSDEGELTYLITPDSAGTVTGFSLPGSTLKPIVPRLISHEFTHMIQFGRRIDAGLSPLLPPWIAEGQAVASEEVVGHAITGRSIGQNYGHDVAFNASGTDETDWYLNGFRDLSRYFGLDVGGGQVAGAPEECTWLVRGWGSGAPCVGPRSVYGTPWSLFRWATDQYASSVSEEQSFHRDLLEVDLSNSTTRGLEELADLVSTLAGTTLTIDGILARWAAALYVDDRISGADALLTVASWDLFDIFSTQGSDWELNPYERSFTDFSDQVDVQGGSTGYFRISGTSRPNVAFRARDGGDGILDSFMQLWVVRLK